MFRVTLALLLCLVAGSRQLSIEEFVVPSSVEADNYAELQCRYKLENGESADGLFVKWWASYANGYRAQLYQRFAGQEGVAIQHDRHKIVVIDDFDTVALSNVTAADTGVYECEVSKNADEVRQHQQLTVFTQGTGPQVNISEIEDGPDEDTDDDVLVECRADGVSPQPDIVLTVDGQEFNMTELVSGPDKDGLYDIAGNVTFSKNDIDGSDIRCELFYTDTSIVHPQYMDAEIYNPSGKPTATEPAEDVKPDPTTETLTENQSGDSTRSRISFGMVFALAALAQLPRINVILT